MEPFQPPGGGQQAGQQLLRCREEHGVPARLVGESDLFSLPSTEEVTFEAAGWGLQDEDVQSTLRAKLASKDVHRGTRVRITTHRLCWHAAAAGSWVALRLDGVASARLEAPFMRAARCMLQLRGAGQPVAVLCAEGPRTEELHTQVQAALAAARWKEGSYEVASIGGIGRILGQRDAQRQAVSETLDMALTDLKSLRQYATQTVGAARQVAVQMSTEEGGEGTGVQQLLEDFGLLGTDGKLVAKGGRRKVDIEEDVKRVCQAALEKRGGLGMLLAHDVFCLVNRARGTAFVSAEEVIAALRSCAAPGGALRMRALGSTKALAVSLARTSDAEADRQLLELTKAAPLSAFRLAGEKHLTAAEAQYLLRDAEARAVLVRDDAPEGVFYHRNFFNDF